MTPPQAFFRAGEKTGTVELVTVTPELIDGQPMPVVRVIQRDPEWAIRFAAQALQIALTVKAVCGK